MRPFSCPVIVVATMMIGLALTLPSVGVVARSQDKIASLPNIGSAEQFNSAHYSGYLATLSGRETFYYFVESERSPANDPLILWLNGGPGCSSLLGLFTEIGPFILRHDGNFYNNPYSWSTEANVLWMESPPGVGFSTDNCDAAGECTFWNDTITAETNYESLAAFVDAFPQFSNHKMFLTGESYAGHYVPQLANQIQHGPNTVLRNMMKGFMIGNPCTGNYDGTDTDLCWMQNDPSLKEFYQYHSFLSFDEKLNQNLTDSWGFVDINPGYDIYDIAVRYCQWNLEEQMTRRFHSKELHQSTQRRSFRLADTDPEEGDPISRYGPCNSNWLEIWLNKPAVQAALHVNDGGAVWSMCAPDSDLNYTLPMNNESKGVLPIYRDLIQNTDWEFLVYSGDMDARVNFVQTEKIIQYLAQEPPLTGQPVEMFQAWHYMDIYNSSWMQIGGFYQKYSNGISWASVKGAGHMAPTNKPAASLQLLRTFINDGAPGALPELNQQEPVMSIRFPQTSSGAPKGTGAWAGYYLGGISLGIVLGIVGVCVFHHRELRRANSGRLVGADPEQYSSELVREAE